jgi:hypothetical protein
MEGLKTVSITCRGCLREFDCATYGGDTMAGLSCHCAETENEDGTISPMSTARVRMSSGEWSPCIPPEDVRSYMWWLDK